MWCYDTCVSVGKFRHDRRRAHNVEYDCRFKAYFTWWVTRLFLEICPLENKQFTIDAPNVKNSHYIFNLMESLVIVNIFLLYYQSKTALGCDSGQTIIYCLRLLCHVLPVSVDSPFLIAPVVFSNVYTRSKWQSEITNGMNSNYIECNLNQQLHY